MKQKFIDARSSVETTVYRQAALVRTEEFGGGLQLIVDNDHGFDDRYVTLTDDGRLIVHGGQGDTYIMDEWSTGSLKLMPGVGRADSYRTKFGVPPSKHRDAGSPAPFRRR